MQQTSSAANSALENIFKRFSVIYPTLIRNNQNAFKPKEDKVKSTQAKNVSSNVKLAVQDQIKLCKALAKSEALTVDDHLTLQALEREVASILTTDSEINFQKQGKELFTVFLYTYVQYQTADPSKGFITLIVELLKKAQLRIQQRRSVLAHDQAESGEEGHLTLDIDISLKNDDVLNALQEVMAAILKKLYKLGEAPVIQLLTIIEQQIQAYLDQQKSQVLNLELFAPTSIVYKVLELILRDAPAYCNVPKFNQLLELTFQLFEIYKQNSKFFLMTMHSSGKQEETQVRRMSVLFTDLLDMLVGFCCQYLQGLEKIKTSTYGQLALKLFQTLFQDEKGMEYFTLRERLRILNDLNVIFAQIPHIASTPYYWGMIREGLYDQDQYCRKVSMAVLKTNLKMMGHEPIYAGILTKEEFELHWTTFFDLYDTLESFGSHLTKAVWERSELFYAYMKKHYDQEFRQRFHPLMDFKEWLLVLYRRVQNHMNLKLRRYVQKSTLKRKYMTVHLPEYVFDEFLRALNKGLIFKDANIYTQFSMKMEQVNQFYERYFTNECRDLSGDLARFFKAFAQIVSHHQLILCSMRNIARDYPALRKESAIIGFVGNDELNLLNDVTNSYFGEQIFSSRYLCWKYLLRILSLYTRRDIQINATLLLKLVGRMPIEFFSNQTTYNNDKEAHLYARQLIERLGGCEVVQQVIVTEYLNDLFQVKAVVSQMPKFGKEIDTVITGVANLILIMSLGSDNHQWLREVLRPNYDSFQVILGSAYLSPEVSDSKVRYLSILLNQLYKYGEDSLRNTLRSDFVPRALHLVLERFENNLLVPLSKYQAIMHQPSTMTQMHSLFSELQYYQRFLSLGITACHIHMNQANSALERIIKQFLTIALKIQYDAAQIDKSIAEGKNVNWGSFLTQYVAMKGIKEIMKCYAKGINASMAKGITYFMVSEDIFTTGKPLFQSMVEFRNLPRPKESEDQISQEEKRFLIDNNLSLTGMSQVVLLNQWKAVSALIQIFHFEKQSREELLVPLYSTIANKAADFLGCSTLSYHTELFRVLKNAYVPSFLNIITILSASDNPQENLLLEIKQYHKICQQCWDIIKEAQTEFSAATLQEFIEFTFHPDVFEMYRQLCMTFQSLIQPISAYLQNMAQDIFEQGNKYWLIARTTFNHILLELISKRPYLIGAEFVGFDAFIVNFAISREVRSLDSEIMIQKMSTLVVQSQKTEGRSSGDTGDERNMEEITYQGAYIRTQTMLVLEELIQRPKAILANPQFEITQEILDFTKGIERIIILLINLNYEKKHEKASMPYSDAHRVKLRCWQTIVVALDYLNPETNPLYNKQLQHPTVAQRQNFINELNKNLWKVIGQNFLPSVRGYIEIVIVRFCLMYPGLSVEDPNFIKTLLDPNVKTTVASSYLIIAGFVMLKLAHASGTAVSTLSQNTSLAQLRQRLMEHMSGFLTSNGAHVRCVAQFFMHAIARDPHLKFFIPAGLQQVTDFLAKNKDCQKVIKRYGEETERMSKILEVQGEGVATVLSTPIDIYGEFLSQPFVERIKEVTSEIMCVIRNHHDGPLPIKRENLWKEELQRRQAEGEFNLILNEEQQSNYQRKILPWEQVEYDHELLKRVYEGRARNQIIMCASLIDKVPNLAGLARTSEIMNANCLVINNRSVCDLDEFKGVSVTSEKWLPIHEVQEKDLFNYLLFQKSNGYKILGLEQTANSKMLHEYKFPEKSVLLLGKEKEGIPQEYLSILDECIEIPQFGVIRSLNVHVSGALCLWEYTKQHLPTTNSSQRQ